MDVEENDPAVAPENGDMAKDVARLYTMANVVEDSPYRTFSRRRVPSVPPAPPLSEVSEPAAAQASAAPVLPSPSLAAPAPPPSVTEVSLPAAAAEAAIVFPPPRVAPPEVIAAQPEGNAANAIAIYSLAGGVGKTTITANLGRVLCARNERVLLVDASGSGLLPFYFGASDLRPGLRTFAAPDSHYPPMQVIGVEVITQAWLEEDVRRAMQTADRTIFDLGLAATPVLPELLQMCAVLLVPLQADLNSLLTVSRIEASIAGMRDRGLQVPLPFYVFNKFDGNNSMDMEARNLVTRQCGDRLLPMSIRRSADINAAIADRMTVADHAPESEVTLDLTELAMWLRKVAPARQAVKLKGRWSER